MTRTHEEAGLGKPADRTTKVCAVDCKHLELITRDAPYPAGGVYGLSVCRHHEWIAKSSHPRLAFGKVGDVSKRHPGEIAICTTTIYRGKKKTRNRQSQHHCGESVEQDSQFHEESAPRNGSVRGRRHYRLS